jgi:hypothetical protein
MDSLGGFGVRRVDEAERGAIPLIERMSHVFYAVSVLNVDVPAVRLSDVIRLQAAQVVTVHENRHGISSVTAAVGSHCDAIVIFVGSDFDLRVAFDVHGSARLFRQAPPLMGTRSARDNRGSTYFSPPTAGPQLSAGAN